MYTFTFIAVTQCRCLTLFQYKTRLSRPIILLVYLQNNVVKMTDGTTGYTSWWYNEPPENPMRQNWTNVNLIYILSEKSKSFGMQVANENSLFLPICMKLVGNIGNVPYIQGAVLWVAVLALLKEHYVL